MTSLAICYTILMTQQLKSEIYCSHISKNSQRNADHFTIYAARPDYAVHSFTDWCIISDRNIHIASYDVNMP